MSHHVPEEITESAPWDGMGPGNIFLTAPSTTKKINMII